MNFVKKAEQRNKERAKKHIIFRRKESIIAGTCMLIAVSIYAYTIYAMKQETFLDDFEMPEQNEVLEAREIAKKAAKFV